MGWTHTYELKTEQVAKVADKCGLWTRGGLSGVEVHIEDKVIYLPREAILDLVAAEYVSHQVSRYEQMDTQQAIEDMMGPSFETQHEA